MFGKYCNQRFVLVERQKLQVLYRSRLRLRFRVRHGGARNLNHIPSSRLRVVFIHQRFLYNVLALAKVCIIVKDKVLPLCVPRPATTYALQES